MRRDRAPSALLIAAILALPALVSAQPEDPSLGQYSLRAWAWKGGTSSGHATLTRADDGLVLTLQPDGQPAQERVLSPRNGGWVYESQQDETDLVGVIGALEGEENREPSSLSFTAHYRLTTRGLRGFWTHRRDGRTFDVGFESLTLLPPSRVRIAVSVDWEGRELSESNLRAMETLEQALPDVPLTHFLNAAYFTKPNADHAKLTAKIQRVVRANDETGLHVHGWKSLIEAAGVTFLREPSFWGEGSPLQPTGGDMGHEVEIAAYSVKDLRAVVAHSRKLLKAAGYTLSGSFRAGGWMATPNVLQAIRAEGFGVDSSATDNTWHEELARYSLRGRIKEVWPDVTPTTQPYWIDTPAGRILEMPDSCALADYVTADEMVDHIQAARARAVEDSTGDLFVHIGFHTESAARYSARVTEAIRRVRELDGAPLVFETLGASAAQARAGLK